MVLQRFYNRDEELDLLKKFFKKSKTFKKSLMVVVHGRRRVGKTRLLVEFLSKIDDTSFYFHITRKDKHLLLTELVNDFIDQVDRFNMSIMANDIELIKRSTNLADFFHLLLQIAPNNSIIFHHCC